MTSSSFSRLEITWESTKRKELSRIMEEMETMEIQEQNKRGKIQVNKSVACFNAN
jgi:hypothetical protein